MSQGLYRLCKHAYHYGSKLNGLVPEHLDTLRDMANPVVGELLDVKHTFPHEYLPVCLWLWSKDLKWAAQVRHEQPNDTLWSELLSIFDKCVNVAKSP